MANADSQRRNASRRWKDFMQPIRRMHLYFGLFMLPWIFLYSITGFLFNHPTYFSASRITYFEETTLAGTPVEAPLDLSVVASEIVQTLNAAAFEKNDPHFPYKSVASEAPYMMRPVFFSAKGEGVEHRIGIDLGQEEAWVSTKEAVELPPPVPFVPAKAEERGRQSRLGKVSLPGNPLGRWKEALPVLMERVGLSFDPDSFRIRPRPAPVLYFVMADAFGERWHVAYDLHLGKVKGRPADEAPELGLRRFLTKLHLTREYSGKLGPGWFWAVGVDTIFTTMVFWGLSGLLMWWQLKRSRPLGLVVVLSSLACATFLAFSMNGYFKFGPP